MIKHKILLLLFLASLVGTLRAQTALDWCAQRPAGTSVGGFRVNGIDFSSKVIRGCAPFKVTVQNTNAVSDKYLYDYKGGDPLAANSGYVPLDAKEYVYQKQGTYRILQLGSGSTSAGGSGSVACQTIQVFYPPNYTRQACSGGRVQVKIADDSTTKDYDEFLIDWGNGNTTKIGKNESRTAYYTYPSGVNTAKISVQGMAGGERFGCDKPFPDLILNTVSLSVVQVQKVTARNDGLVDVLVKGAQGANAELQVSADGGNTYKNTGLMLSRIDTVTLTVRDIDANANSYCFRMSTNDGCDNATSSSNVVCSIGLTVKAEDRRNELSWTPYPNNEFRLYTYNRNNVALINSNNRLSSTYTDRNVACNGQYCYQIAASLANGGQSLSALKCVTAISTEKPSPLLNAFVRVSEDSKAIEVYADPPASGGSPTNFKATFFRAPSGSNDFVEVITRKDVLSFVDTEVNPNDGSYCYKIEYENACGNRSEPTSPVCSIFLSNKSASTIDWTTDSPFLTLVGRYVLEVYDENDNLIDQIPVGLNTSYNPNANNPDRQLFRYRIQAYAQNSPRFSYSNLFIFKREAVIFVPDAFSPNDDGVNDKFGVQGLFLDTSKMYIFNRWGQPIFETDNAGEGWNGFIGTLPAPEGSYVYRIEITDSLGKKFAKVGTLILVR